MGGTSTSRDPSHSGVTTNTADSPLVIAPGPPRTGLRSLLRFLQCHYIKPLPRSQFRDIARSRLSQVTRLHSATYFLRRRGVLFGHSVANFLRAPQQSEQIVHVQDTIRSRDQKIKTYLDELLDNAAAHADTHIPEAGSWERLRPLLTANPQTQGPDHLDTLIRAVLDGCTDAFLGGAVIVLAPLSQSSDTKPPTAVSAPRLLAPSSPPPKSSKIKRPQSGNKLTPSPLKPSSSSAQVHLFIRSVLPASSKPTTSPTSR
ncbi:hypothetical protein PHYPSEUDO_009838 [Phytophthora pseudosyringae]|uniref:Uncharacterized protein n=1 Tax=Phytophthora pseudosyringae TaxID=221518 RepID=A0A8T1W833_9STRA|nr:hypothetical protein PHYPSEUDO_009838 [Phytophthora pseudosyringae]